MKNFFPQQLQKIWFSNLLAKAVLVSILDKLNDLFLGRAKVQDYLGKIVYTWGVTKLQLWPVSNCTVIAGSPDRTIKESKICSTEYIFTKEGTENVLNLTLGVGSPDAFPSRGDRANEGVLRVRETRRSEAALNRRRNVPKLRSEQDCREQLKRRGGKNTYHTTPAGLVPLGPKAGFALSPFAPRQQAEIVEIRGGDQFTVRKGAPFFTGTPEVCPSSRPDQPRWRTAFYAAGPR